DATRWQKAPAISEMIYTFEDALLYSGMLMAIMHKCDVVKLACQALVANISAMIMTTPDGEMWLQTTYYPFSLMAKYGRGTVLDSRKNDADRILSTVVVDNQEAGEIVIFAINRSSAEDVEMELNLTGMEVSEVEEHVILQHDDLKATNQLKHDNVLPKNCDNSNVKNGKLVSVIPKLSWNMIRLKK
ncbi:MAG: alpha-N-arabinofuranosidase, partial [Lachnospiraceae bacterium]|nr:alpha-N-arabinofuranosidase [Lachnospiraceae bacterium]